MLWVCRNTRTCAGRGDKMTVPGRFRTAILVLALLAVGMLVRAAVPARDFFGPLPLPFPDDPPYHLLRVERLAGLHAPRGDRESGGLSGDVSELDPMIAHPFGDQCIWPWGFDWLAAALVPEDGSCGRTCILRIAGMMPVAISLVTALLLFLLARRLRRPRSGTADTGWGDLLVPAAATVFFLLMPGNVAYSMAGRFDHHVMEPLFIVLPMLLVSGRGTARLPGIAGGGLVLGLGAAFFPAAPAITLPLFVICGLFLINIREAVVWCAAMMAGTILSLSASPSPFEWVHYSPSFWHVAVVGCISAGLTAFHAARDAAVLRRAWPGSAIGVGAAAAMVAFLAAGGLAAVFFPGIIGSLIDGITYTTSADFAALSLEASSFMDDPLRMMSLSGWLLPLSIAGLFAVAMPGPAGRRREGTGVFVLAALAFIILAAAQRRFLVAATPLIALSAAFGLEFVLRIVAGGTQRITGRARGLAVILATLLTVAPSLHAVGGMKYLTPADRAMYAAAEAISLSPGDERGTMAPWGYGHLFKYAAGAPTVCDNFFGVPGADAAMKRCLSLLYETDGDAVGKTLAGLGIRFVVFAPPHPDQIRVETAILGMKPTDWVDADDRLSPLFAKSFFGRTGVWASTAAVGATGPWNMTLRGRFRQVDPSTGRIEAEVLLLELVPAEPR